jgi:hypothetical protein
MKSGTVRKTKSTEGEPTFINDAVRDHLRDRREPEKAARIIIKMRARSGKRSPVPKRIPRKQLDPLARGGSSPIDSTIVTQLRTAMAGAGDALMNACLERKLLPLPVINYVNIARFLSLVMLAARAAQRVTLVPASILMSEAWHLAPGIQLDGLEKLDPENDYFETGEHFSSIEASFVDHANRLSRDRKFQPVMRAKDNPAEYLRQLGSCKLWDEMGRKDRVATITYNCLQECDVLLD